MISSVGLEHYLDRVGVTGSNPVSPTMTKKIFLLPIVTLGIIFIVLGLRWMLVDEPWMLDKFANEQRLNMKFEELFKAEINSSLPGYLKQIYKFFGLWVFIIGIFIIAFSRPSTNNDQYTKLTLLSCTAILIYFGMIFASVCDHFGIVFCIMM